MSNILLTVNLRSQPYASEAAQISVKNEPNTRESTEKPIIPANSRFVYPEFLPDPLVKYRHPIREKIERLDMLARR